MYKIPSKYKIPRKPKVKARSDYKVKINTNYPKSPYDYTIAQIGIFKPRKDSNYHDILPVRRLLINLIHKGRITYHSQNCFVSTNKQYLQDFFATHPSRLKYIKHPDFSHLSKIYSSIKLLAK